MKRSFTAHQKPLSYRLTLILLLFLGLSACSSVPRTFSPPHPIDPQAYSAESLDHVLSQHVAEGHVNYPGIGQDGRFQNYLKLVNRVDPQQLSTREERLAFWVNAYNAFAIKGILDGLSPETLWGRYRFFIGQDYSVGGATINLYDLERKLLIPDFREPRIHFAIICASRSCPLLRSEAYSSNRLEDQLDEEARRFINDSSRNYFDQEKKIAHLSKIFDWFTEDFEAHSGSLLQYVAQYVNDPDLAQDLRKTPYHVEFLEYDWRLNGVPPSPPTDLPQVAVGLFQDSNYD